MLLLMSHNALGAEVSGEEPISVKDGWIDVLCGSVCVIGRQRFYDYIYSHSWCLNPHMTAIRSLHCIVSVSVLIIIAFTAAH